MKVIDWLSRRGKGVLKTCCTVGTGAGRAWGDGGWRPRWEEDESSAGEGGRETTAAHGHSVRE